MAQGGLAHDQSVPLVASCPGQGQVSQALRGSLKRSDPATNATASFRKQPSHKVLVMCPEVPTETCQCPAGMPENIHPGGT